MALLEPQLALLAPSIIALSSVRHRYEMVLSNSESQSAKLIIHLRRFSGHPTMSEAFADAAEGRAPYPVPQSQMIANISALEAIFQSAATGAIVDVVS